MNQYEKMHDKFVEDATNGKQLSPLKAIRHFCLECVGYQQNVIKDCGGEDCPLYKFRYGKNATRKKRKFSPERLAQMKKTLAKARKQKS